MIQRELLIAIVIVVVLILFAAVFRRCRGACFLGAAGVAVGGVLGYLAHKHAAQSPDRSLTREGGSSGKKAWSSTPAPDRSLARERSKVLEELSRSSGHDRDRSRDRGRDHDGERHSKHRRHKRSHREGRSQDGSPSRGAPSGVAPDIDFNDLEGL
jgi:hypothetical protein